MTRKGFLRYVPLRMEYIIPLIDSPIKGELCGAFILALSIDWTNGWTNGRIVGYLRRHDAHVTSS